MENEGDVGMGFVEMAIEPVDRINYYFRHECYKGFNSYKF